MMSLETFAWLLPALGAGAVLALAEFLRGATRRMALLFAPLVVGYAMWWLSPSIPASQHNWLAGLAKMVWYGLTHLAIGVYYVVFLVSAIGLWLRNNQKERARESRPLEVEEVPSTAPTTAATEPPDLGKRMAAAWKG